MRRRPAPNPRIDGESVRILFRDRGLCSVVVTGADEREGKIVSRRPNGIRPARIVTRGHGVSIHRIDCSNFRTMSRVTEERVIGVEWGTPKPSQVSVYAVDIGIEAADRQGLLRDISEVFAREKMNVIGVQTQSLKGTARMTFTIEITDSARLAAVLQAVSGVSGVRSTRRR